MRRGAFVVLVGVVVGLIPRMPARATAQSVPRNPLRTVSVGPIPGDPLASGTRLLEALASINPSSCPGDNWRLAIAPGLYDLGGASLVMKPCVDVEGAGQRATKVTSAGDGCAAATVIAASDTELRLLTIESTWKGLQTPACAVRADGTGTRLSDVTLLAGVAATTGAVGIAAANAPSLTLDRVRIASTGWFLAHGVEVTGTSLALTDVAVVVAGDLGNVAVVADSSTLTVSRSRLVAPNGNAIASSFGLTARVVHTQIEGDLGLPSGMACFGNYDAALAPVTCP